MYCSNCGTNVEDGIAFCTNCGAQMKSAAATVGRTADEIDYRIVGDDMQAVIVTLDPGEGVRAEPGSMMYMQDGIRMQTGVTGGIWKGIKRAFTGESMFQSTFTNEGPSRSDVAFAAPYPGHDPEYGRRYFVAHKHDRFVSLVVVIYPINARGGCTGVIDTIVVATSTQQTELAGIGDAGSGHSGHPSCVFR